MVKEKKLSHDAKSTTFTEDVKIAFSTFRKRLVDGSIGTKLSHLIFGMGNLLHGQIIKGLLFLSLQAGILAIMILCPTINNTPYGWKALANLSLTRVSAGGEFDPLTGEMTIGSDCKLMILFGFVTIAVIIIYFMLMKMSIYIRWIIL